MFNFYKTSYFFLVIFSNLSAEVILNTSNFSNDLDGWVPWVSRTYVDPNLPSSSNYYGQMQVGYGPGNQGSRLVTYNRSSAWTGNYIDKAVTRMRMNFFNDSPYDTVFLRVAISDGASPQIEGSNWWISKTPVEYAPSSGWSFASFDINEASMKRGGVINGQPGFLSFADTLTNIQTVRILSSVLGGSGVGDQFYGVVGLDDIQLISVAIPEPNTALFNRAIALVFLLVVLRKFSFPHSKGE